MDLIKHIPSKLNIGDNECSYHTVDNRLHAANVETQHTSQNCPRMTAQQAMTCLNARPTWAQMVEVATQQEDKNENAHEGSGTTDTITPCKGADYLLEQQWREGGVHMSAMDVTVPTAILNRSPTNALQEADTEVKQHGGIDKQAHGPISPNVLKRGEGTIFGHTVERDYNDRAERVQGKHLTTGTATQDEDFPPLCEEFSCTSQQPKGSLPRKKKRLHMEETMP